MLCFTSCSSCKKEINALPEATQTGKNTFGCLIDGQAWIPSPSGSGAMGSKPISGGYMNAPTGAPSSYGNNNVWVNAYNGSEVISLYIRNVNKTGTYPLNFNTQPAPANLYPQNYAGFTRYNNASGGDYFMTTSNYTGTVEITRADTVSKILAGRFSFVGINNMGETISVTDGRFDLNQLTR